MRTLAAALLAALPACAQITAGSISGYVLDPSHLPVPGAVIVALWESRGIERRAASDAAGRYVMAGLPPALYLVRVEAAGFPAAAPALVAVGVDTHVRVDCVLRLAERSETIEVRAVTADSSGNPLPPSLVESLPLNRRDFLQLALLAPGVLPPVDQSELSRRGRFAMHAGGAREEFNNYLIDGADNNDHYENTYAIEPSVDSIQEFKIASAGYSAALGRSAGAQVNVVTRGGGNGFHGTLYEYLRNRRLDARNFFDSVSKPAFVRHQFGSSAGGALRPDRAFYFLNYEGLRERRGLTRLATVPLEVQRAGVFNSAVTDPFTRQPFPGNTIPTTRIAPLARRVLALFPLPNRPGAAGNLLAQPVFREASNQFHGRFDHASRAGGQLMLRYSAGLQDLFEPYTQDSTDIPGFGDFVRNHGQQFAAHHQRPLGSRALHSVRFGFTRSRREVQPENHAVDVGRLWNVAWLRVRERDFGYPLINVAGLSLAGDVTQLPLARTTRTWQAAEDLSLARGGHSLRLGGELRRIRASGYLDYFARGSLSFSGALSGAGLGDLLLGLPSFGIQAQFDNPQRLGTSATGLYAQDDWRLAPGFTLSFGLRYEYTTPPTDPGDRMSVLNLARSALSRVGTDGVSRSGLRPDRNNLAPRLGFAWAPTPRLAVRGGYGLYYDSGMFVVNSSNYFNPPYFNVRIFFPTAVSLLTLDNPFPSAGGVTPPASPNTLSPDIATSNLQSWSLGFERQWGSSTVLSFSYAGSKGTRLIRSRDLNQPRPGPGAVAARRPNPVFGGIFFIETGGNSSFHSLQASAVRRLSRGLSLLAAYTLSKSIDDASAFLGTRPDKNFPQDSRNYRAERAVSSFDLRQRLTAGWTYSLPGRVELRGLAALQGGRPFTPILRFDNSNTGNTGGIFGADRPDLLRNPSLATRSPERWFDTGALPVAAPFQFGNAGRNTLRGPALAVFDLALSRRFALTERLSLQAEAQAFNLFNRANFDLPERFADDPAGFGRIFSAKASRQGQLSLRLIWQPGTM